MSIEIPRKIPDVRNLEQQLSPEKPGEDRDFLPTIRQTWNISTLKDFQGLPVAEILQQPKNVLQRIFCVEPLAVGKAVRVDFRGHREAERYIGLGHLIQDSQQIVEVVNPAGLRRKGERKIAKDPKYFGQQLRDGYFDRNGYIPVQTGFYVVLMAGDRQTSQPVESKPTIPARNNPAENRRDAAGFSLFDRGEKAVSALTPTQCYAMAHRVFGEGPGAELLIALDKKYGGEGVMIQREIALGIHENRLRFGGTPNRDPGGGYSVGTYQIHGGTPGSAYARYERMLEKGMELYRVTLQKSIAMDELNSADKDLLGHLGYISSERGGEVRLRELANPDLSRADLARLMSKKIQGGIAAIGNNIAGMLHDGRLKVEEQHLA